MTTKKDLLFELGTEELPPVALKKLSDALTHNFTTALKKAGLTHSDVHAYATPRRLALYIQSLDIRQQDRNIEKRGPAVSAAFDADGNATRAAQGFARGCGVDVNDLGRVKTDKGEWLVYQVKETGKVAVELLPEIATQALSQLPIPKRMRWGNSTVEFVRPVQWLVFMLGDDVVPCNILDAQAGKLSRGHRFHSSGDINITSAASYESLLNDAYVIADFDKRKESIRKQVEETAADLGGVAEIDEALLDEVTGLVEWPKPIAGGFEDKYLEVPHEALIITMKKNQKYFPVFSREGQLMPHFITLSNIDSANPEIIAEGNERVVRPRLADAMFFWEQDAKLTLEQRTDSLKNVVFQKKLGNMSEKSERVASLAKEIAAHIGGNVELAQRAGRLSRCDLMTDMVGEFASMQGIMGRYQAKRDNEDDELAMAMEEFYMPRFSGDQLPQTPTGIAIALAERLDTLVGIFGIGMKPTGDKDPFALRRAALGALRIMREHSLTLDLKDLLKQSVNMLLNKITEKDVADQVYHFMMERLKGLYLESGQTADVFEAVANISPDTISDFDKRVQAVSEFRQLSEAESLAAANKRIRNILRKNEMSIPEEVNAALFEGEEEKALYQKINDISATVNTELETQNYSEALKTLAGLRDSVDDFFEHVMVMADDAAVRGNRLALLSSLSTLFMGVADISSLQK